MDPARTLTPEQAPVILVEHRERLPWQPWIYIQRRGWFLPTKRAHLKFGDYAIEGLERFARIEKKAADLYSTLLGSGEVTELGEANPNLDRFRREMMKFRDPMFLEPGAFTGLWIEGREEDLLLRRPPHADAWRKKDPADVFNMLASLQDYGVPITFVGSARVAGLRLGTAFYRIWRQATMAKEQKKAAGRQIDILMPWIPLDSRPVDEVEPGCFYCGERHLTCPGEDAEQGCSWCSFADGSTTGEPCNMCGRNGGVVEEAKEDGNGQA